MISYMYLICDAIMLAMIGGTAERISTECKFDTRCQCYSIQGTYLYSADCINQKLSTIPAFENDIQKIDFGYNLIREIPDSRFEKNTRLQELSLGHNRLQSINMESFVGLSNLTYLNMNHNIISHVGRNSFSFLQKLQILDLKNNNISTIDLNFTFLRSLRTLRIDFNANESHVIPRGLVNLRNLDVSGRSGKCEIKRLTNKTFEFVPTLQDLDLSACKINNINNGTFRSMTNLSKLDVSFNPCLKFRGIENITYDLPFTSIKIFKMNKVHQPFELNTELQKSHILNLNHTHLVEIQMESNRIQLVEEGALLYFPQTIRNMSMSHNYFSFGSYIYDALAVPVQFLNLSYLGTPLYPFEPREFCNVPDRDVCDQTGRRKDVPGNLQQYKGTRIPIPPNLKTFIYKQCELRYEIPPLNFTENVIEYLDGSINMLYSWTGPLLSLDKVYNLNLSYNQCYNVSKVFFKSFPNLRRLYIQNNLLGFVIPGDFNGEILQSVPKLEEINLSENRIPSLPYDFFRMQTRLKQLFLAGNMLEDIDFQISHTKELLYLDISDNRISSLDNKAVSQLDAIFSASQNITINLSGNPLKCTCDTIQFIKWMATTKVQFYKHRNANCYLLGNNKIVPISPDPELVYAQLQKHCSSYTSLIIGVVASLMLFVFILIFGLIYRHRWRLRYMFYMVKYKYKDENKNSVGSQEISYEYDAFISYEDTNRFFVHDKLLHALETEGKFKLCLHKRDFLPGNDIAENITSAIHRSRKVIVIMSQNYIDSYWCMFEYNMARVESIYARNTENILFLVFLEEISAKNLPLIVLELIRSQTFIEYPNDEYGDTVFWEKLKEVLL